MTTADQPKVDPTIETRFYLEKEQVLRKNYLAYLENRARELRQEALERNAEASGLDTAVATLRSMARIAGIEP